VRVRVPLDYDLLFELGVTLRRRRLVLPAPALSAASTASTSTVRRICRISRRISVAEIEIRAEIAICEVEAHAAAALGWQA
jgi:hypothetical protein